MKILPVAMKILPVLLFLSGCFYWEAATTYFTPKECDGVKDVVWSDSGSECRERKSGRFAKRVCCEEKFGSE